MVGAGICHTDLGVMATIADDDIPIVLGHEGSGVVEAVGSGVTVVQPGDHVVLSYNSCGTCDHCCSGIPMHCRSFTELNLAGLRSDGSSPLSMPEGPLRGHFFGQSSWATHAVANEHNVVKVDPALPLHLLGPLGCGIQTGAGAVLNTLRPQPGSSIVVFGAGSVGLAAILAAVVAECAVIVAVDIQQSRLDQAKAIGATHTINSSSEDVVDVVHTLTGGRGAQYSVECIGLATVVRSALECLQSPGVCASVGFQGVPNEITIDQGHLLFGRSLIGVIEGDAIPTEFIPHLIDLYQQGKFDFTQLIDTFAFDDINKAIDAVHRGDVTKAVLTFDDSSSASTGAGHV
ncbi:NAD(P)-dependent alcohol dehydrogenase [Mycolicibacterium neoaurum]|nr:NAD(P)-dependent alcohol dehydrogenase [Mycolicibacterium neoaurum]